MLRSLARVSWRITRQNLFVPKFPQTLTLRNCSDKKSGDGDDASKGGREKSPACGDDTPKDGREKSPACEDDTPKDGREKSPACEDDTPKDGREKSPACEDDTPKDGREKSPACEEFIIKVSECEEDKPKKEPVCEAITPPEPVCVEAVKAPPPKPIQPICAAPPKPSTPACPELKPTSIVCAKDGKDGGEPDFSTPVKVSGLIKLARWSMLIAGIIYGFTKHQQYAAEEVEFQKEECKRKKIRDRELAELKRRRVEAEKKALALLSDPISLDKKPTHH